MRISDWSSDVCSSDLWNAPATRRRFAARHSADRRLQIYGLSAIALAVLLITVLIGSLVSTGYQSFVQTHISFEVYADPAKVDAANPAGGNFRLMVRESFAEIVRAHV